MKLLTNKENQSVTQQPHTIKHKLHTPIRCKFLLEFTHKLLVNFLLPTTEYLNRKTLFVHETLRPRKPYEMVDSKIKNLVEAMNATNKIITISSCEGHGLKGFPPYVYFKSNTSIASKIECDIRNSYSIYNSKFLNFAWEIEGRFDSDCNLTFSLYSPDLDTISHSNINSFLTFYICRNKVDEDFIVLENLFRKNIT